MSVNARQMIGPEVVAQVSQTHQLSTEHWHRSDAKSDNPIGRYLHFHFMLRANNSADRIDRSYSFIPRFLLVDDADFKIF
jgi:hypothetical protein